MPRFIDELEKRVPRLSNPRMRKTSTSSTTTTTPPPTPPPSGVGKDVGAGIAALLPKNLRKRKTQGLDLE